MDLQSSKSFFIKENVKLTCFQVFVSLHQGLKKLYSMKRQMVESEEIEGFGITFVCFHANQL